MKCDWETKKTLPDGRRLVVCKVCGTKRTISKSLVRTCGPDIVVKKKPCKGCPENKEPENG
jgi:hypothetical protein